MNSSKRQTPQQTTRYLVWEKVKEKDALEAYSKHLPKKQKQCMEENDFCMQNHFKQQTQGTISIKTSERVLLVALQKGRKEKKST